MIGVDLARSKKQLMYDRGFLFAVVSVNSVTLETFSEVKARLHVGAVSHWFGIKCLLCLIPACLMQELTAGIRPSGR